jgi:hypothetical protein
MTQTKAPPSSRTSPSGEAAERKRLLRERAAAIDAAVLNVCMVVRALDSVERTLALAVALVACTRDDAIAAIPELPLGEPLVEKGIREAVDATITIAHNQLLRLEGVKTPRAPRHHKAG